MRGLEEISEGLEGDVILFCILLFLLLISSISLPSLSLSLTQTHTQFHSLHNDTTMLHFAQQRHAENAGIQTEKLENLRISIAKGSPLWETLNMCIEVVDEQSLEQLIPRLSQLARSGVGLNTRYKY